MPDLEQDLSLLGQPYPLMCHRWPERVATHSLQPGPRAPARPPRRAGRIRSASRDTAPGGTWRAPASLVSCRTAAPRPPRAARTRRAPAPRRPRSPPGRALPPPNGPNRAHHRPRPRAWRECGRPALDRADQIVHLFVGRREGWMKPSDPGRNRHTETGQSRRPVILPLAHARGVGAEGLEMIAHDLIQHALRRRPRFVASGRSRHVAHRREASATARCGRIPRDSASGAASCRTPCTRARPHGSQNLPCRKMRGERPVPRLTYLEGVLELDTPHETAGPNGPARRSTAYWTAQYRRQYR
jgi:hypothetical protein